MVSLNTMITTSTSSPSAARSLPMTYPIIGSSIVKRWVMQQPFVVPMRPETLERITPRALTVSEVADRLRCSKAHVHNLINGRVSGISPLPSIQLGRRRIVRTESLAAWLTANENATAMIRSSPEVDAVDA
jgi:excisionase family DNA binding protein